MNLRMKRHLVSVNCKNSREELQNDLDKVQKQMQNIENMKVQLSTG